MSRTWPCCALQKPLAKSSSGKRKAGEENGGGGPEKEKKKRKKKDPDAPKRALSGFMYFSQAEREVRLRPLPESCAGTGQQRYTCRHWPRAVRYRGREVRAAHITRIHQRKVLFLSLESTVSGLSGCLRFAGVAVQSTAVRSCYLAGSGFLLQVLECALVPCDSHVCTVVCCCERSGCYTVVQNVKRDNPGIAFTEIGKILGERWKGLSGEDHMWPVHTSSRTFISSHPEHCRAAFVVPRTAKGVLQ